MMAPRNCTRFRLRKLIDQWYQKVRGNEFRMILRDQGRLGGKSIPLQMRRIISRISVVRHSLFNGANDLDLPARRSAHRFEDLPTAEDSGETQPLILITEDT